MHHTTISRDDARLSAVLLAPVNRLLEHELPAWGKIVVAIGASFQFVMSDAFYGAVVLLFVAYMLDHAVGVARARLISDNYDALRARRGAMTKALELVILGILRLLEHYLIQQGLTDTKGALATAVALGFFVVNLQSIVHHREALGAKPVPVLGALIDWLTRLTTARIPSLPAGDVPKRREGET